MPHAVYSEFADQLRQVHASLRQQPGFVSDLLLEQPASADSIHIISVVRWENTEAAEAAKDKLCLDIDRDHVIDRLKIISDIGLFSPIEH
ncbi:antibiotic biosynthesis monooxygenase [Pleomorphomonas sp. PLEO]|uniref:antibiotic biosynthesis monooxygenase family protein n=1 Tax=Pleomorphomonas sp. PLEO TaxID=3239306 RepID=UPI00351E4607